MKSLPMSIYEIILRSHESMRIMRHLLLRNVPAGSIGELRALVKLDELGMSLVWVLTLKIPVLNGGADTAVKRLLLLMNTAGKSEYLTYSDGSIVTRCSLSVKDPASHLQQLLLLSPVTSTLLNGILTLTGKQEMRY